MVYADSKQMLDKLVQVSIPNSWDYNFVQSLHKNKPKIPSLSLAQYIKVVELFNKYVCVPCSVPSWRHDGTNRK